MMKYAVTSAALTLGLAVTAAPALAHHSFAIFDSSKRVTLEGTVKDFQWTNPHSVAWIQGALSTGGAPALWSLELTAPSSLIRMGWSKRSLKPGDKVSIELTPSGTAPPGGALKKVTFTATGEMLRTESILTTPLPRGQAPAG